MLPNKAIRRTPSPQYVRVCLAFHRICAAILTSARHKGHEKRQHLRDQCSIMSFHSGIPVRGVKTSLPCLTAQKITACEGCAPTSHQARLGLLGVFSTPQCVSNQNTRVLELPCWPFSAVLIFLSLRRMASVTGNT